MSYRTLLLFLFCFVTIAHAQQVARIYPGVAPGSERWDWKEGSKPMNSMGLEITYNVVDPTLTVYKPETGKANGTAVIICPGGGFHMLAMNTEGVDVAKALVKNGITCFVLKYRLTRIPGEDPFAEMMKAIQGGDPEKKMQQTIPLSVADGRAAITYVRSHAAEWAVKPDKIGIMGFSAGGTVTASAAFGYDAGNRPDFVAPVYPFMPPEMTGTVAEDAPPMFLVVASDDQLNLQAHSVALYTKWNTAKKPVELHAYSKGGHGFGMRVQHLPSDSWLDRFTDWMALMGFMGK